jgi:hypothetical protein
MVRRLVTLVTLSLLTSAASRFGAQKPLQHHRLNGKKPSVYIELVKSGEAKSLDACTATITATPLNSIEWRDVSKAPNLLRVMILLRCNQVVPATDTPAAAGITHGQ